MGDIAADVEYGRMVVQEGGLKTLREIMGLTRNAMADMLYVSVATYTNWEIWPEAKLWPQNAGHIGRFFRSATAQVEYLMAEGIDPKTIMPLHEYAMMNSVSQDALFRRYRRGELDALDLGILGLWVKR